MVTALLAGGAGVKPQAQAQAPSQKHIYFSEGFSGTDPRYDATVWNVESEVDTGYRRLFYSTVSSSGGESPEAVWGYAPSAGLDVVLSDTLRFATKPFTLQAASRSYVSMKYLYQSLIIRATNDGLRSFGLAARRPGGNWMPCGIVGSGGLKAKMGPERLTAELPAGLKDATEVEVCVYLQNRLDLTELKNHYMLYFDDIEFFAYPEAYHDLDFSWTGRPYEFTGFVLDTVGFAVDTVGVKTEVVDAKIDTVGVVTDTTGVVTDTIYELLDVNLRLENIGNALKSGKIAYTFDGGAVQYLNLAFESPLLPGQTHTEAGFEPAGWAEAAEGHHTVIFWLAEADGVALAETDIVKHRTVLSKVNRATVTTYPYKPLVEEFSSSSCVTCAPKNRALQPIFEALGNSISLVKYQMYFPGNGDPYYTGDGGQRKQFYDIKEVPDIYLNGWHESGTSTSRLLERFKEKIDVPAYFNLSFDTLALSADTNIYIVLKLQSSLPMGNVRLHTAVIEGQTEGNASSNGETEFHHVMLKMLPDGGGLGININPDTVYTFRYAYDMKQTFMEEIDDLKVVCFLQASNDTVLQSAIDDVKMRIDKVPDLGTANERTAPYVSLAVYPNPAAEEVTLPALNAATVEVFNMAGHRVFHRYGVQGDYRLNVRDFRPGIYVIRVVEANRTAWAKICVMR